MSKFQSKILNFLELKFDRIREKPKQKKSKIRIYRMWSIQASQYSQKMSQELAISELQTAIHLANKGSMFDLNGEFDKAKEQFVLAIEHLTKAVALEEDVKFDKSKISAELRGLGEEEQKDKLFQLLEEASPLIELNSAIKSAEQAAAKDSQKNYIEAYELYSNALLHLLSAIENEQNPAKRNLMIQKKKGWAKRTNELMKILQESQKKE